MIVHAGLHIFQMRVYNVRPAVLDRLHGVRVTQKNVAHIQVYLHHGRTDLIKRFEHKCGVVNDKTGFKLHGERHVRFFSHFAKPLAAFDLPVPLGFVWLFIVAERAVDDDKRRTHLFCHPDGIFHDVEVFLAGGKVKMCADRKCLYTGLLHNFFHFVGKALCKKFRTGFELPVGHAEFNSVKALFHQCFYAILVGSWRHHLYAAQ